MIQCLLLNLWQAALFFATKTAAFKPLKAKGYARELVYWFLTVLSSPGFNATLRKMSRGD